MVCAASSARFDDDDDDDEEEEEEEQFVGSHPLLSCMPTLLRVFMSVPAHIVPRTPSLVVEITVIAG